MSSLAARLALVSRISDELRPRGFTYIKTGENRLPDVPPGEPWFTVFFNAGPVRQITLGSPARWRESGTAEVTLYTPAGAGLDDAIAAIDAIATTLPAYVFSGLWITGVGAPQVLGAGDAEGLFAAVATTVSFNRDYER